MLTLVKNFVLFNITITGSTNLATAPLGTKLTWTSCTNTIHDKNSIHTSCPVVSHNIENNEDMLYFTYLKRFDLRQTFA